MTLYKKVQNWAAKSLIRSKRIKEVRYSEQELNEMIVQSLPHSEDFEVPGGQATLVVMSADITIGNNNTQALDIKLLCSIDISSLSRQLYRAHLDVKLKSLPYYNKEHKTIRLKETNVNELKLINDEYLLIKSSNDIVKSLTPNILKGIVNVTINSALNVMGDIATPAVKEYLAVFTEANKQKVLDFHKPQLEKIITTEIENGGVEYQLDPADFEEKIFAELGQQVDVEEQHLVFKF